MKDEKTLKQWLHDLANGDQEMEETVKGFIAHYVLCNLTMDDVERDIASSQNLGHDCCPSAIQSLRFALQWYANRQESRTLDEVQQIVDCIRSGCDVAIEYYAPDVDDDPYVRRPHW